MVSLYTQEQQLSFLNSRLGLPPRWHADLGEVVVERINRGLKAENEVSHGFSNLLSHGMPLRSFALGDGRVEDKYTDTSSIVSFADPQLALESILDAGQLLPPHVNSLIANVIASLTVVRKSCPSPACLWDQRPPTYERIVLALRTFHSVKMLFEVAARTRGEKIRWRMVLLLESVQAMCRLMLLRSWRTTVAQTGTLKPVVSKGNTMPTSLRRRRPSAASIGGTIDQAQRLTSQMPGSSNDAGRLLRSFLRGEKQPLTVLVARAMLLFQTMEVLCILRPVLFACMPRR